MLRKALNLLLSISNSVHQVRTHLRRMVTSVSPWAGELRGQFQNYIQVHNRSSRQSDRGSTSSLVHTRMVILHNHPPLCTSVLATWFFFNFYFWRKTIELFPTLCTFLNFFWVNETFLGCWIYILLIRWHVWINSSVYFWSLAIEENSKEALSYGKYLVGHHESRSSAPATWEDAPLFIFHNQGLQVLSYPVHNRNPGEYCTCGQSPLLI